MRKSLHSLLSFFLGTLSSYKIHLIVVVGKLLIGFFYIISTIYKDNRLPCPYCPCSTTKNFHFVSFFTNHIPMLDIGRDFPSTVSTNLLYVGSPGLCPIKSCPCLGSREQQKLSVSYKTFDKCIRSLLIVLIKESVALIKH